FQCVGVAAILFAALKQQDSSMHRRLVALVLLVVMLTACATGDRIQSMHEGMSKDEVIAALGNPDGFQQSGDYEVLRYRDRVNGKWPWDRATDYNVILKNGRAVQYGPGRVVPRNPNALILVPELN